MMEHPGSSSHALPLALLKNLQRDSFDYFFNECNPLNGLIKDKTAENWPASIAAVGMALTVYPIAVERGFMAHQDAVNRTLATLQFFADSKQGTEPDATGYKGFYYHFLDMQSGQRAWGCEISSIDTALLMAGILTAADYFCDDKSSGQQIRTLADMLYRRVDWQWLQDEDGLVRHGWRPEFGFLPWRWEGYDEALILYILALGSPTFPLHPTSYAAWCKSYEWKSQYGIEYLYAGPLFIHQMSHVWLDLRGIQDDFMRDHGSNYFENSRRATKVQQQYAIANPLGFVGYNALCWGITASDGPGPLTKKIQGVERQFFDYVARGVPYGPDDGTVAPWAVAASLPFAPEIVLPSIEHFHALRLREANPYGFKASFSTTFHAARGDDGDGRRWVSPYHFGINEGPTVIMIENHLHDFPWKLMRNNPYLRRGLEQAGFSGGWLDQNTQKKSEKHEN